MHYFFTIDFFFLFNMLIYKQKEIPLKYFSDPFSKVYFLLFIPTIKYLGLIMNQRLTRIKYNCEKIYL